MWWRSFDHFMVDSPAFLEGASTSIVSNFWSPYVPYPLSIPTSRDRVPLLSATFSCQIQKSQGSRTYFKLIVGYYSQENQRAFREKLKAGNVLRK